MSPAAQSWAGNCDRALTRSRRQGSDHPREIGTYLLCGRDAGLVGISRPTGDPRERIEYDLIVKYGESPRYDVDDDAFWEAAESMTDDELTDALLIACGFRPQTAAREDRDTFRGIVVNARR